MNVHHNVGSGDDDLDRVFRAVEGITSVGAFIGVLEQLTTSTSLADDEIFGWPVLSLRHPRLRGPVGKHFAKILQYPNVIALLQTRALAATGLLVPGASRAQRGAMAGTMCGSSMAMQTRMGYGLDGSDHFAFINYAGAMLEKLFPNDRRAREAAAAFIAAQSCMSYFTAGVSKLISPAWRDGTAIAQIFRTGTYGDRAFYEMVRDRPALCKAIAWSTIAGEMAFPLALVAPKPVTRGILGMGLGFHLANAKFMGLNRFIWSFAGTYPAVAHVSEKLGPALRAKALPAARTVATRTSGGKAAWRLAAGAAVAVGAGAGAAKLLGSRRRTRLAGSAPGEFVRVGGRKVHVMARTSGSGPTVVFENAMACPATEWAWVTSGLHPDTPYLSYDRPGAGWSEPTGRQSAAEATAALKQLIDTLGLQPPYIMVGHSVGGLLIRSFTLRNPGLVGGLVFVDSSHPDQLQRSGAQRDGLPWVRQSFTRRYVRTHFRPDCTQLDSGAIAHLPDSMVEATNECLSRPELWGAARRELAEWTTSWASDARRTTDLSPRPIAVLTAGKTVQADRVHGELQRELAALSDDTQHEIVQEANHDGLVMSREHASRVTASINWVSSALTTGQPEALV
ncbi:alpha/beta fold hydrolase [Streptomyces sp. NBC_00878]|uniref:alpha/beta fold hydrolase n=1 Tax=Streptomyces sp. NBC_00878 TaxID=2975854 RepID=UPI00225B26B0|nr:alpha/beta fold hydrolase [Streptomyces sp. NBC_00878]MCX4909696.1 alpha/beta fold hydrolase [Streptomyces sp. NBC_00878]